MSADSAVTYTSVHSEARSWSIPSEDPYEEAARQLLEQAPRSPEYVTEDHVPVYIPEPEHPEDLVPAKDEAPAPLLPPFFLSPRIRPPLHRAAMRQILKSLPATTIYYHSLLPSGTSTCCLYLYHLLAAELIFSRLTRRPGRDYYLLLLDLSEDVAPLELVTGGSLTSSVLHADMPPQKRLLLTTPRPSCEVGESSAAVAAIETCLRAREYGDPLGLG
ncbi:hypothetical protein Tco_1078898 [Tanacetum coccineum]|uniref:Uncharacterized protein n=1 Tax=Tanacetum coccineum TaxID=301880 RepID=A0ABQ5HSD1_9ASTR